MPCGVHASESRKPEARLIKRFHLPLAGSSTSPHGKAGPYPAVSQPPFPPSVASASEPGRPVSSRLEAGCQSVERTRHD